MGLPGSWRRFFGPNNQMQPEVRNARNAARVRDRDDPVRRRLEAALRNALDFRAGVMEADTNGIAVLDAEGRFVLANQRACEISGYNLDEFVGRDFRMLLPEAERVRVSEQVEATLNRGMPVSGIETEMVRKHGSIRIIRFSLQPLVLEDGRMGAVGTAEDITERKQAEQALLTNEALYRDLVE